MAPFAVLIALLLNLHVLDIAGGGPAANRVVRSTSGELQYPHAGNTHRMDIAGGGPAK